MKKFFAVGMCFMLLGSTASASVIPKNMTVNVNLNLDGVFGGDEKNEQDQEPENNTYGERVGGQSVHTEERSNDPPEKRNTDEMKVTNDQVASGEDPIIAFLKGLF